MIALFALVSCFALQFTSRAVFRRLGCYAALESKQQTDWDTRIVGIVHGMHLAACVCTELQTSFRLRRHTSTVSKRPFTV